jgi:transcription initiation factor TFIIH subunit 2
MLPSHASREILILMGSLTTCDPGDISVTIEVSMSGLPEENLFFLLMRMKAFRTLNYIKTL